MNIEMIEPTTPATPTQPVTHQGVFMDKYQAPNLVGIILQALEQHIEAMVDKRFNERMNDLKDPSIHEIKDIMTEMFDEMMDEKLEARLDEKLEEHTDAYDHEKYDEMVGIIEDSGVDDIEEKIKDVMRNVSVTLDI